MQVGWIWVKQGFATPPRPVVCAPDCGDVTAFRVRGEVENIAVPPRRQHDRVGDMRVDLPGHEVADNDAAGRPIDDDQVEHLVARVHLDRPLIWRSQPIGAEQQLLAGLTARVECARDLHTAE